MPTLPFDDEHVEIVERIGKNISGSEMDTNVIGRYSALNRDGPDRPRIKRIAVLGLTDAIHGNGQGVELTDITIAEAIDDLSHVEATGRHRLTFPNGSASFERIS